MFVLSCLFLPCFIGFFIRRISIQIDFVIFKWFFIYCDMYSSRLMLLKQSYYIEIHFKTNVINAKTSYMFS